MKQSPDSQMTNLEVEFQVPSFHFIKQLEKEAYSLTLNGCLCQICIRIPDGLSINNNMIVFDFIASEYSSKVNVTRDQDKV